MSFSIANVAPRISKGAARHFRGWSRVGLLVLLLSVFFQSYVAQTHIHGAGQALTEITQAAAQTPQAPAQDDDDHGNCLLCQAVLHAGAVMLPATLAVLLPVLLLLGLAEASFSSPSLGIFASHAWRSRAPPLS